MALCESKIRSAATEWYPTFSELMLQTTGQRNACVANQDSSYDSDDCSDKENGDTLSPLGISRPFYGSPQRSSLVKSNRYNPDSYAKDTFALWSGSPGRMSYKPSSSSSNTALIESSSPRSIVTVLAVADSDDSEFQTLDDGSSTGSVATFDDRSVSSSRSFPGLKRLFSRKSQSKTFGNSPVVPPRNNNVSASPVSGLRQLVSKRPSFKKRSKSRIGIAPASYELPNAEYFDIAYGKEVNLGESFSKKRIRSDLCSKLHAEYLLASPRKRQKSNLYAKLKRLSKRESSNESVTSESSTSRCNDSPLLLKQVADAQSVGSHSKHSGSTVPLFHEADSSFCASSHSSSKRINIGQFDIHEADLSSAASQCSCPDVSFKGDPDKVELLMPRFDTNCGCHLSDVDSSDLENILRPWQVQFLNSQGINYCEDLVYAHRTQEQELVSSMQEWRENHNMKPFKKNQCALALHIWTRASNKVMKTCDECCNHTTTTYPFETLD